MCEDAGFPRGINGMTKVPPFVVAFAISNMWLCSKGRSKIVESLTEKDEQIHADVGGGRIDQEIFFVAGESVWLTNNGTNLVASISNSTFRSQFDSRIFEYFNISSLFSSSISSIILFFLQHRSVNLSQLFES